MKEKRKFIRFETSVKVNYIAQKDPKIEKTATTKNITAGGLQLLASELLDNGAKLELKIFVPNAMNPVHITGSIIWVKEPDPDTNKAKFYTYGIEFGKIEEDNKNTFLKFLCELMYKK